MKVCPYPPTRIDLAGILSEAMFGCNNTDAVVMKALKKTAKLIRKKPPNKEWMLLVLAQIEPGHHIFSKQHTKPTKKKVDAYEEVTVNVPSGFFDGLVLPRDSGKKVRNYTGFIEKQTK